MKKEEEEEEAQVGKGLEACIVYQHYVSANYA